jgi:hypothetical protein
MTTLTYTRACVRSQMIHNTRWLTQPKLCPRLFMNTRWPPFLAVSAIHAMKREQSRILAVSAILTVSVARVIWRDRLAKIADTETIGIGIEWFIWYNLSSVVQCWSITNTVLHVSQCLEKKGEGLLHACISSTARTLLHISAGNLLK